MQLVNQYPTSGFQRPYTVKGQGSQSYHRASFDIDKETHTLAINCWKILISMYLHNTLFLRTDGTYWFPFTEKSTIYSLKYPTMSMGRYLPIMTWLSCSGERWVPHSVATSGLDGLLAHHSTTCCECQGCWS